MDSLGNWARCSLLITTLTKERFDSLGVKFGSEVKLNSGSSGSSHLLFYTRGGGAFEVWSPFLVKYPLYIWQLSAKLHLNTLRKSTDDTAYRA